MAVYFAGKHPERIRDGREDGCVSGLPLDCRNDVGKDLARVAVRLQRVVNGGERRLNQVGAVLQRSDCRLHKADGRHLVSKARFQRGAHKQQFGGEAVGLVFHHRLYCFQLLLHGAVERLESSLDQLLFLLAVDQAVMDSCLDEAQLGEQRSACALYGAGDGCEFFISCAAQRLYCLQQQILLFHISDKTLIDRSLDEPEFGFQ